MKRMRLFWNKKALSEEQIIGMILFIAALLLLLWIAKKKLGSILGF